MTKKTYAEIVEGLQVIGKAAHESNIIVFLAIKSPESGEVITVCNANTTNLPCMVIESAYQALVDLKKLQDGDMK